MRFADVNVHSTPISMEVPLMDEMLDRPPARFVLTLLTSAVIASLLPLIYLIPGSIPTGFLKWSIVLVSGFSAGLAARFLLKASPAPLQFVAAFSAILLNTTILGWLTMNLVGYDWNLENGFISSVRWGTELILECLVAAITIRAWNASIPKVRLPSTSSKLRKQPGKKPAGKPKPPAVRKSVIKPAKSTGTRTKIRTSSASRKKPTAREILVVPNINRQSQSGSSNPTGFKSLERRIKQLWENARIRKNGNANKPALIKPRKAQPKPKAQTESSTVKLLGEVEHRCPYCLEIVKKNDPRGIKVCPVCQTQHHLDCWNITGVCQVPHQSE